MGTVLKCLPKCQSVEDPEGEETQQGQQSSEGHALTISKIGSGSVSVTHNGSAMSSGASLSECAEWS